MDKFLKRRKEVGKKSEDKKKEMKTNGKKKKDWCNLAPVASWL